MWAWRDDDADNKLNLDLKHTYKRVSSRKYNLIKLAGSTASQAGSRDALVYAFLALVICTLYMWQDFVLSKIGWVKKANPPVPMIIIWFRSRAATVILVCCFHDPRVAYLRDGPLEKLWGGGGIFEPQEFFFVIKFLVWIFLGHSMNIF